MEARVSLREMNSSINASTSTKSRISWWTWQTAKEFRRFCVIVLRSHVFKLRSALKLRSASADEAGETRSKRTNFSTSLYSPRSSGAIALNIQTASLTDLTECFLRKSWSWICKYANRSLHTLLDQPLHPSLSRLAAYSPRPDIWGDLSCHENAPATAELQCRQARKTADGSNQKLLYEMLGGI